jgi:hypothetical protein
MLIGQQTEATPFHRDEKHLASSPIIEGGSDIAIAVPHQLVHGTSLIVLGHAGPRRGGYDFRIDLPRQLFEQTEPDARQVFQSLSVMIAFGAKVTM